MLALSNVDASVVFLRNFLPINTRLERGKQYYLAEDVRQQKQVDYTEKYTTVISRSKSKRQIETAFQDKNTLKMKTSRSISFERRNVSEFADRM